jgi:hypothetical protein
MHRLTAEMIDDAEARLGRRPAAVREHDDCVRIAYEWLDAQKRTQERYKHQRPLKHMIEAWAGLYVSQSDVELAAELHPTIKGRYPNYNVSGDLVEPSLSRLNEVKMANTQPAYRDQHKPELYKARE